MPKDFVPVTLSELKTLTDGEFYDDEFSKYFFKKIPWMQGSKIKARVSR